jgi:hypothetical protein
MSSDPLPQPVAGPRAAALFEREGDLAVLGGLLADARAGEGRLAVVEGPAGIGKTRLLEEARAAADRLGLEVLHARGGERPPLSPSAAGASQSTHCRFPTKAGVCSQSCSLLRWTRTRSVVPWVRETLAIGTEQWSDGGSHRQQCGRLRGAVQLDQQCRDGRQAAAQVESAALRRSQHCNERIMRKGNGGAGAPTRRGRLSIRCRDAEGPRCWWLGIGCKGAPSDRLQDPPGARLSNHCPMTQTH